MLSSNVIDMFDNPKSIECDKGVVSYSAMYGSDVKTFDICAKQSIRICTISDNFTTYREVRQWMMDGKYEDIPPFKEVIPTHIIICDNHVEYTFCCAEKQNEIEYFPKELFEI